MIVHVNKLGFGSIWSFRPASQVAEKKMRRLFKATWVDGAMYVEHRYEIETARRLRAAGFTLLRDSDGAEIEINGNTFVLKESAA